MENLEVLFKKRGILKKGHFLLSSGLHSDTYLEKFRILEDPSFTGYLISLVLPRLKEFQAEAVVGPTTGGALVAYEVARLLQIKAYYAEHAEVGRIIRRDFTIKKGETILVVDDVLTTGKSITETMQAVEKAGGKVSGIFVLIDRAKKFPLGVPLVALYKKIFPLFRPTDCPLCKTGEPITTPGKGIG